MFLFCKYWRRFNRNFQNMLRLNMFKETPVLRFLRELKSSGQFRSFWKPDFRLNCLFDKLYPEREDGWPEGEQALGQSGTYGDSLLLLVSYSPFAQLHLCMVSTCSVFFVKKLTTQFDPKTFTKNTQSIPK